MGPIGLTVKGRFASPSSPKECHQLGTKHSTHEPRGAEHLIFILLQKAIQALMELWSGAFFPGYQCLASLGLMLTVVRPVCGPFSFMTLEKRMDRLPQLSREAERGESGEPLILMSQQGLEGPCALLSWRLMKKSLLWCFKREWPPGAHLFEYLAPNWWTCLGRVKARPCWRRCVIMDESRVLKDSHHPQRALCPLFVDQGVSFQPFSLPCLGSAILGSNPLKP